MAPRVRTSPFTLIYITIKVGGGEGGGGTALQTEYLIKCVAINMKTRGFQCCLFSGICGVYLSALLHYAMK